MNTNDGGTKTPVHAVVIVPLAYVYANLICEFDHWDLCLKGLITHNEERWLCWIEDDDPENTTYRIQPVQWNDECDEYMNDYRKAYIHWFHDVEPRQGYDGRPIGWFREKWGGRDPIGGQSR